MANVVVLFEVKPTREGMQKYLDLAAMLKPMLAGFEGFIRAERFTSLNEDGKLLSIVKAVIYHRKRKGRSLHNRGCDQSLIRKYFLMNGNRCGFKTFLWCAVQDSNSRKIIFRNKLHQIMRYSVLKL